MHEEAEEPKVVVDRVARRQERHPGGEWGGRIVSVQRGPEAERELALVAPVGAGHVAAVLPFRARVGLELQLSVRRHGLIQRFQACLHDEEEEGRAERAPLLDAHGAGHCHGLAVEVEGHLEVRVHALDDADQVGRHAELGEHASCSPGSKSPASPAVRR